MYIISTVAWIYPKLWSETNRTKEYSKKLLIKSPGDNFIFLPVFYLIMWVMKAPKNFGKITILKIWELISLGGLKTHFGKLALKWCIFRHEIFYFELKLCPSFWSNWDSDPLSTSKWLFESQFFERFWCSWQKNCQKGS